MLVRQQAFPFLSPLPQKSPYQIRIPCLISPSPPAASSLIIRQINIPNYRFPRLHLNTFIAPSRGGISLIRGVTLGQRERERRHNNNYRIRLSRFILASLRTRAAIIARFFLYVFLEFFFFLFFFYYLLAESEIIFNMKNYRG